MNYSVVDILYQIEYINNILKNSKKSLHCIACPYCIKNQMNFNLFSTIALLVQCTRVRFTSLHSGGFTTMTVINTPERILAKRTSVQCGNKLFNVIRANVRTSLLRLLTTPNQNGSSHCTFLRKM